MHATSFLASSNCVWVFTNSFSIVLRTCSKWCPSAEKSLFSCMIEASCSSTENSNSQLETDDVLMMYTLMLGCWEIPQLWLCLVNTAPHDHFPLTELSLLECYKGHGCSHGLFQWSSFMNEPLAEVVAVGNLNTFAICHIWCSWSLFEVRERSRLFSCLLLVLPLNWLYYSWFKSLLGISLFCFYSSFW